MLIAVNYHYIRERFDAPYPSIFGVTPQEFSDQLDLLGTSAEFLSAQDIVDIIDGRKALPSRAIVITFDDGFREQYEIAWPILQEKGISAIFFVNTKPIEDDFVTTTHKIHIIRAYTPPEKFIALLKDILEKEGITMDFPDAEQAQSVYRYDTPENAQLKYFLNHVLSEDEQGRVVDLCFTKLGFNESLISRDLYMNREMIAHLAEEGVLGSHGHAHRPLGLLNDGDAITDFDMAIERLEEWTGHKVVAFSYPFGFKEACSRVIADHVRKKGLKFAFTMERAGNRVIDAPMFLGRFSNSDVLGGNNCINGEQFWESLTHSSWFRKESLL